MTGPGSAGAGLVSGTVGVALCRGPWVPASLWSGPGASVLGSVHLDPGGSLHVAVSCGPDVRVTGLTLPLYISNDILL